VKTDAAILVETGKPLEIGRLDIPKLGDGQCLVEISFSGACHTQLLEARGRRGKDNWLPHCLGHEASGIVFEVGDDVTRAKPGDRVALSWIKASGIEAGGAVYQWEGKPVNAGAVTTFQRHAVVSENRVTVLPDELGMQQATLLGCALPTGLGAVINVGKPSLGESVAIFGAGGVGLCAVMGAVVSKCDPVIAIDLIGSKLEMARGFGATHTINVSEQDVVSAIAEICPNGVDLAIEASGRPTVMATALSAVRSQGGRAVVIGNAPKGQTIVLDPLQFNLGKSLLGTWGGDSQPDRDFPMFASLMIDEDIKVSPLFSAPYTLESINDALEDLEEGRIGRPLIAM
jgi:S-(hydroxymethyl)glutathione dehydrogenase/alcohol dehydrogenase